MKQKRISLPTIEDLLSFFPKIDLPVSLTEESVEAFSKENKPLPPAILQEYIYKWEPVDEDDLTEYIPCLCLDRTEDYIALIYWKAGLLTYEYMLVTITDAGDLISKKVIASTVLDQDIVKKSAAVIDEDMIIHIVAGAAHSDTEDYNPAASEGFSMEIMEKGKIIFSKDKEFNREKK